MLRCQNEQPPWKTATYRLFQPFAVGKKIDRANPAASRGMEFRESFAGLQAGKRFAEPA
ncbi:hypothetical protein X772_10000 [Mesorhizobium sp. LSJC280B00]|nr:hypothetical protein X772_10000 [Mesorhizobium sp. LSJC280B00]